MQLWNRQRCTVEPCLTDTAIYDIADTLFGPECIYIIMFVYKQTPWNAETSIFCKVDRFPSPNSTWTVQNSLHNPDACLPLS